MPDLLSDYRTAFAGIALIVSIASLVITIRFQRRFKQADILAGFHNRFDHLQQLRADLLTRESSKIPASDKDYAAKIFFDRFWSLQFDQYVAWQQGYVPFDIYRFWFFARWQQFHDQPPDWNLNGQTVKSTFEKANRTWAKVPPNGSAKSSVVNGFLKMYESLLVAQNNHDVDQIICRHAPLSSKHSCIS